MLSMPTTRKTIRKQDEVAERLRHDLAVNGVRLRKRLTKQAHFIDMAKSGRDPNLKVEARRSVDAKRQAKSVRQDIDLIAGRA